jgi:hypothetical protein
LKITPTATTIKEPGKMLFYLLFFFQDVLENDDIKLDNMFKMSFLMDLGRV